MTGEVPALELRHVSIGFDDDPVLHDIPVVVHTARRLDDEERSRLRGAVAIVPKDNPTREAAMQAVRSALALAEAARPNKMEAR